MRRKEKVEFKYLTIITDQSRHKGLEPMFSEVILYERDIIFNVCHLYIVHSVKTQA